MNPPLLVTGTFYVGWNQTTDDNLSIGFDRYNNSQQDIFWNCTGSWNTSALSGSLMIRPVVGKPIPLGTGEISAGEKKIILYPNPCNTGMLHLQLPESSDRSNLAEEATLLITDLVGHKRIESRFQKDLNVSTLPGGLYFLEVRDRKGMRMGVGKFIISR
jgi:hypothetical protein